MNTWTTLEALCSNLAIHYHKDSKLYGGLPYFTHCNAVARLAKAKGCEEDIVGACFLHDTIEDTGATANSLAVGGVPPEVIALVELVTDPAEGTRKEKKKVFYSRLRQVENCELRQKATIVKLCDRIINTMQCLISNPGLLEMYRKEYKEFRTLLYFNPGDNWALSDLDTIEEDLWSMLEAISP